MALISLDIRSVPVVIGLSLIAVALFVYRRISTHPLYHIPGPWLARLTNFHHSRHYVGGKQPFEVLKLHEKYGVSQAEYPQVSKVFETDMAPGPVVRTAPNDVSFSSSRAWRDIYSARKGHLPFIKSEFYDGGNFAAESLSIVSERNPEKHGHMRKYLASVFSDRSLKEQEDLIAETVDELIEKLKQVGDRPEGTDMTMWYNLATFDIIGNLAFGETFNGVKSGTEHPWIVTVMGSLRKGALADCMKRFPIIAKILMWIFSKQVDALLVECRNHEMNSRGLVERRIARDTTRKDFMSNILEARQTYDISDTQISAHASDFVIAGSETTATSLACATYFLLRNPVVAARLRDEIRQSFKSYDEIDAQSTAGLQYLTAVCKEAMRVYPPLPFALPRIVPQGGDVVDGHVLPAGTVVSAAPFASSMTAENFHDPWTFKPERWLSNEAGDDLEASQPFSLGPRGCMGKSMGWMEMRTILAKICFTFDMELVDQTLDWHKQSEMYTLWKKPNLMVRLRPVSKNA